MPALNQNPLLTLDALASCGAVLPTEVQAALDTSLSLKGRELGVQQFLFWGRLSTLNGKDYYIACAFNGTKLVDGKVILNPGNKFYYSQDGVNWLDLEPVSGEQAEKAAKLECWLTGDPSHQFTVYEEQPVPEPEPVPEVAEGEEPPPPPEPVEAPPPLEFPVSELEYLMNTINAINAATACAPVGMYMTDAAGNFIVNPLFTMKYPDQLSSYQVHGDLMSKDVPGSWGIIHDSFKQLTVLRSFTYPGFFAYYSSISNTVGNLYFGNGLKNKDLAFSV